MGTPQPAPAAAPSCVMLLTLWAPPAARWHARLVETDAQVHEFESPFELARFLAQAASPSAPSISPPLNPVSGLR